MSRENVMRLLEDIKNNEDLNHQYLSIMERLSKKDISEELSRAIEEDWASLVKSVGYNFSLEELKDFCKTEIKQLSDEELDSIAGGGVRFEENHQRYYCPWSIEKGTFIHYIRSGDSTGCRCYSPSSYSDDPKKRCVDCKWCSH